MRDRRIYVIEVLDAQTSDDWVIYNPTCGNQIWFRWQPAEDEARKLREGYGCDSRYLNARVIEFKRA